jgi:hypothetical protein
MAGKGFDLNPAFFLEGEKAGFSFAYAAAGSPSVCGGKPRSKTSRIRVVTVTPVLSASRCRASDKHSGMGNVFL